MIFKMHNCDFGINYNDVSYNFEHVEGITVEDPENTRLVRGANAANQVGLVYTEGTKEPKKIGVTLIGVSAAINSVLTTIYKTKARCEVYIIDRTDGSSKIAKNAILTQQPQQLAIDESPESMNVVCMFESFDLSEVHKS
jgi:hypothetical protein